jgi:hypothetical protein
MMPAGVSLPEASGATQGIPTLLANNPSGYVTPGLFYVHKTQWIYSGSLHSFP